MRSAVDALDDPLAASPVASSERKPAAARPRAAGPPPPSSPQRPYLRGERSLMRLPCVVLELKDGSRCEGPCEATDYRIRFERPPGAMPRPGR